MKLARIVLTEEQSAILAAAGRDSFTIIGRQSYPADPSLFVVTIAPLAWKVAVDAANVLLGTHAARRIKTQPQVPPGATAIPSRTP
ncbi:MAG: hypothetical protein K9M97_09280 [Akkermansiaceae bacterium]|nr:hypothetical protein [Akkermansiaceae bacterium]